MNLMGNAIEQSPPGGRVTVTGRLEGATFTLTVSDEGPAIAPEQVARLFRPFERAGHGSVARAGSFGLGVSITKDIVDAHGGTVGASPGLWASTGADGSASDADSAVATAEALVRAARGHGGSP